MNHSSLDAERARSVLSHALTAQVYRNGSCDPVAVAMTEVRLSAVSELPATSAVADCVLEVADAAPVPVRDRIRSRVRIEGREVRTGCPATHVVVDEVVLVVGDRSLSLSLEELLAAEPDPLADSEAAILTHLVSAHDEVLQGLLTLVPHRHLQGAVTIRPLRLDRHGVELRIEYVRGHRDHQLAFDRPVSVPDELPAAMTVLIARARAAARRPCPRASSWPAAGSSGSPVEAIIRAAEAARRLCGP